MSVPYSNDDLKRKDSRLRDWNNDIPTRLDHIVVPWKEKILDYEIETRLFSCCDFLLSLPWKEKILDYEIETMCFFFSLG